MQTRLTDTTLQQVRVALNAVHSITLLRGVLDDRTGQAILSLLRALVAPESDVIAIAEAYSKAFQALALAMNAEENTLDLPDAWQSHLITRILHDVNAWSMQAEQYGVDGVASGLLQQAQRDLRALRLLFDLTAQDIWNLVREIVASSVPELDDAWVPWYELAPSHLVRGSASTTICQRLLETPDWTTLIEDLTAHWARHGAGLFARYHVLRWQGREEGLHGIAHPDLIQLHNLIGYEREQARLKANTERFLAGLPAHDVVLYGAPGTGKSSTVKALANAYADRGLRLIEIRKELVHDLPLIVAQLRGRAPRFLLFIDDLSFEDHETSYKALKVLLEGAAEARPANMLIYATTNRLNLVREYFTDRGKPNEDVHWRDTLDEKASLVTRFGLRITFVTPDQSHYLKIATTLAQQRGLTLSEEELHARALTWEKQHVGRSGRAARQFVDDLEAELGIS